MLTLMAVVLLILLALGAFLAWGLYAIVPATFAYVTHWIAAVSGLNPELASGIIIVAAVPFFFALAKTLQIAFRLIIGGFGNPRPVMYRSVYGMIVVVYIGVFFLSMYFFARQEYYRERCVKAPEGLRAFADLRSDQVYGPKTHPCTLPETVAPLGRSTAVGGPKRMNDASRESLIREQEAAQAKRQKESAGRAKREREAAARRKEAAGETPVAQLIHTSVQRMPNVQQVAVLVFARDGSFVPAIENVVAADVARRGLEPVRDLFRPAFVSSGIAGELMRGDWSAVRRLDLSGHVEAVVIGSVGTGYGSHPKLGGVTSADTRIRIRCFSARTGASCGDTAFESKGTGVNRRAARSSSYSNAAHALRVFVRNAF